MPRPLLYVHAHKCLRHALSSIALRAGATAYEDDVAVLGLVDEVRDIAQLLRSHAKNEERNIHPLLARIDAPAKELEDAHHVVEQKIDELLALAETTHAQPAAERQPNGIALYRLLSDFNAFYASHMKEEEERFLPMVMAAVSDEEIIATREKVHAGISFDDMVLFVRYQLPALAPQERIDVMKKYKKQWDADSFAAFCSEAEGVLTPEAWRLVNDQLGDGARASTRRIEDILAYWFGPEPDAVDIVDRRAAFWFANPQNRVAIDQHVRKHFTKDYERACRGELSSWTETPRGRLAVIVLLDQFSRNLYRDDPRAFSHDPRALNIMLEGIQRGDDKKLRFIERMFFYMPLMHSETLESQNMALECYGSLAREAPEGPLRTGFERVLGKAKEHHTCIERFGRYPHRNAVLGRKNTPEEQASLDSELQPGRGAPGAPPPSMVQGK